jgi:RNA-directed DNA polymerase
VKSICQEIKTLKHLKEQYKQAVQIERVNAMLIGLTEYHKSAICKTTFHYIDDKINRSALATFRAMFGKHYQDYYVPLMQLTNRPVRHKGYETRTFAVKYGEMYIGITKAFLTHSQWKKYFFNQNATPYTKQGRELYLLQHRRKKSFPLDRPALYDIQTLTECKEQYNFEYYMNREYAYNRDRGKCKICGEILVEATRHCHHINEKLTSDKINKVANLAWVCKTCDEYIHGDKSLESLGQKVIEKIQKYQLKLG